MSKNEIKLKQGFGIFKNYPIPLHKNDFKLQAILVYSLSRIKDIDSNFNLPNSQSVFENEEDDTYLLEFCKELKTDLLKLVPTFDELEKYILNLQKKTRLTVFETIAFRQCTPLIRYHNAIIYECEKHFKMNTIWIPDLVAISLINFWVIEYSKTTSIYHALFEKYDFQAVLDKYNKVALKNKKESKGCHIKEMYDVVSMIVLNLDKKPSKGKRK